jgi:hypothetical protein
MIKLYLDQQDSGLLDYYKRLQWINLYQFC